MSTRESSEAFLHLNSERSKVFDAIPKEWNEKAQICYWFNESDLQWEYRISHPHFPAMKYDRATETFVVIEP